MSSYASGSLESALKLVSEVMRFTGPFQYQLQSLHKMLMDHKSHVSNELLDLRIGTRVLKNDKELLELERFGCQEELEELQNECRVLKGELASLRVGERMWGDNAKRSRDELERSRGECDGLKKELGRLRGEEERVWGDRVERVQDELGKCRSECEGLKEEIVRLREDESDKLKRVQDECAEKYGEIVKELRKRVSELNAKCVSLKKSKVVVAVEKLKLQDELKMCRKECEGLKEKLDKAREDEKVSVERVRSVEDRYAKYCEEQSEIASEKDRMIAKKVSDVEKLEQAQRDLMKECVSLEREYGYAELEKLKILDELEEKVKECVNLKEDLTRSREKERVSSAGLARAEDRYSKFYEKQSEITNEKDLAIAGLSEKLVKTESELRGFKAQKIAADQIIKELRQRQSESDKTMEELRTLHAQASNVTEALRTQILAFEAEKLRCDQLINKMRHEQLEADQIVKELRSQNSQPSSDTFEDLRGLISNFESDKLRSDHIIKDLRRQQSEADKTAEELRSQNFELSGVVEDLSNRIVAFEAEKLEADLTIKKLRKEQLAFNQTIQELRSQSAAAYDVIGDIKKRILASEAHKLMELCEADKTMDDLQLNTSEASQTIEKSQENLNACDKDKTIKSPVSQGESYELGNVMLLGPVNADGGVSVGAVLEVSSTFNFGERACTGMQRTGTSDLPHRSSLISHGEENDNAESPHQADAQSCYNPQDEPNCMNQGKNSKKLCGSASIEVFDSDDEGSHDHQLASQSGLSANLGQKRKICELSSSGMVSPFNFIPRRKRSSLKRTYCNQQKEQMPAQSHERDKSVSDFSESPSSRFVAEADSPLTSNPVLERCDKKAITPSIFQRQVGNSNSSFDDEISADSEDESACSESSIINIITGLRTHKLQKRMWTSEVDMLNDFLKDIEQCMNAVCVLYRQKISTPEFSNRGLAHFEATGGCALAEYLIHGDPEHRLRKFDSEVEEERPGALDQCRRIAVDYGEKLYTIYRSGEDPFFKATKENS